MSDAISDAQGRRMGAPDFDPRDVVTPYVFERFGGYAAGIATGLLGFVQLYWDPNRQATHDRVARTVVVRTRRS